MVPVLSKQVSKSHMLIKEVNQRYAPIDIDIVIRKEGAKHKIEKE